MPPPPPPFTALLVLAGSGTRLGLGIPKAFVPLAGRPLWRHAAETFAGAPGCRRIVLVAPEGRVDEIAAAASDLPVPTAAVAGGARRQDSVRLGLGAARCAGDEIVAVHDAARPLVLAETIVEVVRAAAESGAAIAAVPVRDTLKEAGARSDVHRTVPREGLWHAQTPQAFRAGVLAAAHEAAEARGLEVTDDAGLVEYLGLSAVRIVRGDPWNVKITEPGDLAAAEALLSTRRSR